MRCTRCRKNQAKVHIKHLGDLCSRCFSRVIEKRVRKELRLKELIAKDDRILVVDDKSTEYHVSGHLLKNIIKG
ncbi:hypothetical protein GF351_03115, partial [Candidatus Woesearchaeota archaeon]|nr:hypothetical protein [Candidatus Woesearchaeota archaeon]